MKKLFLLVVLAALGYGVWKYLEKVQDTAVKHQDALKSPSEKALKDFDKEK